MIFGVQTVMSEISMQVTHKGSFSEISGADFAMVPFLRLQNHTPKTCIQTHFNPILSTSVPNKKQPLFRTENHHFWVLQE